MNWNNAVFESRRSRDRFTRLVTGVSGSAHLDIPVEVMRLAYAESRTFAAWLDETEALSRAARFLNDRDGDLAPRYGTGRSVMDGKPTISRVS